jgi:Trk K+ transport system NAD-binding subunit
VTTPRPAEPADWTGHVIVCGLGELGLSIVEQLHFSGVPVVVVEERPDPRLFDRLTSWAVPLVAGSPRDLPALTRAGALQARAVICVEDDDLSTLETALLAQGLRPDLRVVAQMSNEAVGGALSSVIGNGNALNVAELAAPSLVQACLGRSRHELSIEGQDFATFAVTCREKGTLRSVFGDLAPIAVVSGADRNVDVCPGRDRRVEPGDVVTVLGTPDEVAELPGWAADAVPTLLPPTPFVHFLRLLRRTWWRSAGGFRAAMFALVGVVLVAATVIRFAYRSPHGGHLSGLTSLYFTVETVATVGFGDFSFATQATWMKVFGIVLIIVGATLVTTMFALLTNLLVSRSVADALGSRRVERMKDHIVVIGLGAVGLLVVDRLTSEGWPVAVVERDEHNRHLAEARGRRLPIILGDATQPATLDSAHVAAASAVAVLTSDDLTNVETALSLRGYLDAHTEPDAKPKPIVLRIFDRSLAETVGRNFGFRYARSTSALAAPWFVGAALGLHVLATFYVERERLLVARLDVAPAGGLAGVAMRDLSARLRVVAISRASGGGLEHPPRRDTRFEAGDRAYLVGPYEELLRVLRRDSGVAARTDPVS